MKLAVVWREALPPALRRCAIGVRMAHRLYAYGCVLDHKLCLAFMARHDVPIFLIVVCMFDSPAVDRASDPNRTSMPEVAEMAKDRLAAEMQNQTGKTDL